MSIVKRLQIGIVLLCMGWSSVPTQLVQAGNVIGAAEAQAKADSRARGKRKGAELKRQVDADPETGGADASSQLGESSESAESERVENPMFYYTHLLPSPYTLPAGRFVLSTELAYGITDFLQVGTNVVADLFKVFNAHVKVALLDFEGFALGATLGWQSFNYRDFDSQSQDRQMTSLLPGLVTGIAVAPRVSISFGGNLSFLNQPILENGAPTSGYFRGATVETDIAWQYYRSRKGFKNVLAGGLSYDFTYQDRKSVV